MTIDSNSEAIDAFAHSCELLNGFARELRIRFDFGDVRTGADIRKYDNGWRLEKYVEADVDSRSGHTAAWWIDLRWADGRWIVSSSVSISHTDIHIELPEQSAADVVGLRETLKNAIDLLIAILEKENPFAVVMAGMRRQK